MASQKMRHLTKIALLLGSSLVALSAVSASAQEAAAEETTTVTVLGSRIPRIKKEGPAPVTTITSEAIAKNGYTSVPDLMKSLTQNGGETQGQQSGTGAATTPGASQVDLRGLGPNHSLVMVNGRRVAEFPMPYQGLSNFTDTSNIPLAMIEKVEVLSGSASAIYGSDAIAGVVNFELKRKPDGTTLEYRYGMTEAGGGQSQRLSLSTGFEKDKLSVVFGAEYFKQDPLWGYEREIQDSNLDSPVGRTQRAEYVFAEYDWDSDVYVDPGSNACDSLQSLGEGSVQYALNYWDEPYCGSYKARGYNTIINQREALNTFTAVTYTLSDTTTLFADIQLGNTDVALLRGMPNWAYQDAQGNTAYYLNQADGIYGSYERLFMPEEIGGIENAMTRNHSMTVSITPGIKGSFGDQWTYEAALNYSSYSNSIKFPMIIASKANDFFLGANLGTAADPEFNAPLSNVFRALTPTQYASISADSRTKAKSWTKGLSLTLNHPALFELPAGPVGFAAVAELDSQGYSVEPDANALDFGYYYGYAATSGSGSRAHQAIGAELSIPVFSTLQTNVATRYDQFKFDGKTIGKLTYNAGLEYRPIDTLLVRAAYGTGFRAPDLHYVFAELDLFHPTVTDYYQCRTLEPTEAYEDCSYAEEDILKHREGSRNLKPETSKSFNGGFVWAPAKYFDISVDYFNVELTDQVQDMRLDQVLRDEADCVLGVTDTGASVNTASPTCVDAKSRVHRDADGNITFVYINPINVASEKTDGIDIEVHASLPTSFGKFDLTAGHTYVFNHTSIQFDGDTEVNQLAADSGYFIPREKSNASLTWSYKPVAVTLSGTHLGKIQNWNEDAYIKPSYLYNANVRWDITPQVRASLTINNVLDTKPTKDPTYRSYPYYDISWFDSVGRSAYLNISYKFN